VDVDLVPATESDRAFFVRVHHESYRSTIEQLFGWDDATQDAAAERAFDSGGIHIVMGNSVPVGVVGWEHRDGHVWLKELFILPEHQGRGIGRRVIARVVDGAQGQEVRLRTLRPNLGAVRLYRRCGFELTGETDRHRFLARPPSRAGASTRTT
jgi:RimJ/RimL family protein N-acetyltransferase